MHRPPHQRVVAGKMQHRIREVLCAAKLSAWLVDDFTWALKRERKGVRKTWRAELFCWNPRPANWWCYTGRWMEANKARLKERFKAKFPLSLYIPTIFFTTGGVPFKKNLDLIMVFKCSQRTLISSFIVPENCGWKFTTIGVKLRVWKQLSGSRHCCSLKILPFVSLW